MKIICGTDLGEQSKAGVAAANALANRFKSRLEVVHVMPVSLVDRLAGAVREMHESECESGLADLARGLSSRGDRATTRLVRGHADEELARLAAEEGGELLVVGRHGERESSPLRMGRTAERIAESSPAPTLIVRDEQPFLEWNGERPLRVMVAWEFDATSENALRTVARWRAYGPLEITVVHLDWPDSEASRMGVRSDHVSLGNSAVVQEALERDVRRRAAEILGEEPKYCLVEATLGRLDSHWADVANDLRPDLVVCGTHQRHGLSRLAHGSFSRGLLEQCEESILIVPLTAPPPPEIPRIRTVLAATDFSDTANAAISMACAQVANGGRVHLIHVVDPYDASAVDAFRDDGPEGNDDEAAEDRELRTRLGRLFPTTPPHRRVHGQTHVVRGSDVPLAICQCAERFGADLICLGSHGRTGISKLALGSVANAVIAQTERPVTVVKAKARNS